MTKESMYLYPNPFGLYPCSMRPEEARRHMAREAEAWAKEALARN
jgi:hypothetical protein